MTLIQRQKLKSRLMIFVFALLGVLLAMMSDANAFCCNLDDTRVNTVSAGSRPGWARINVYEDGGNLVAQTGEVS